MRDESGRALLLFRRVFTTVWLVYDLLDLLLHGTASGSWAYPQLGSEKLRLIQIGLILAQTLLLIGIRPMLFAFVCFALRFLQAWYFISLNDFYYYSVVMLVLSQARISQDGKAPAWVRDVLVWQAAWIYFATALLKLNPEWLSGGHLFVRIQYLAGVYEWPYPDFFRAWTSVLSHDAWLSWLGASFELLLAGAIAFRAPRWIPIAGAIALHAFAAFTVNVWFFGPAIISQVALVRAPAHSRPPVGPSKPGG
jgi:Vitamin K-dependent gamma-carboxylase